MLLLNCNNFVRGIFSRNESLVAFGLKSQFASRVWYSSNERSLKPSDKMMECLKVRFPLAKHIEVVDVSGGCGSMYEVFVESIEFKGLSMVKQHRLINETLKEDIKKMHGLRIQTKVPDENR
ncbi:hypothetical protein RUM43_011474 [Polyplax serrata]|uniref:BolA-like protein 3 n=1 Tax=Polyplax serrata TaxID=468196 RepID=A0AAN8RTL6_POLSC